MWLRRLPVPSGVWWSKNNWEHSLPVVLSVEILKACLRLIIPVAGNRHVSRDAQANDKVCEARGIGVA